MKPERLLAALLLSTAMLGLGACGDEGEALIADDAELQQRVMAAIAGASDLPEGLDVQVSAGVVTVSGNISCPECGGFRTPATVGSIQQSLGAVIRAVPSVQDVRFNFLLSMDGNP